MPMNASQAILGVNKIPISVRPDPPALEHEMVRAVLAHEKIIALTGEVRAPRLMLLDRAVPLLIEKNARIIRVASADGQPLNLKRVMAQVVGSGPIGGTTDPVERFFEVLTMPQAHERHLVLIVDDADLLTTDAINYLGLVGHSADDGALALRDDGALPLQIVFSGRAAMWERLAHGGMLAIEGATTRLVLYDEEPPRAPTSPMVPQSFGGTVTPFKLRQAVVSAPVRSDPVGEGDPPLVVLTDISGPSVTGQTAVTDVPIDRNATATVPATPVVHGEVQPGPTPSLPDEARPGPKASKRRLPWALVAIALLVTAGGLALWQQRHRIAPEDGPSRLEAPQSIALTQEGSGSPAEPPQNMDTSAGQPSRPADTVVRNEARLAETPAAEVATPPSAEIAPPAPVAVEPVPIQTEQAKVAPDTETIVPTSDGSRAPSAVVAEPTAGGGDVTSPKAVVAEAPETSGSGVARSTVGEPSFPTAGQQELPAPAIGIGSGANAQSADPDKARPEVPTVPPVVAHAAPPVRTVAAAPIIDALVRRGDSLLATGDIAAARQLYTRAADNGSGSAAKALGMTYDPRFLSHIGALGIASDPKAAATWYRRASELGDTEGAMLLGGLEGTAAR
jgi:hypothetical protein